MVGAIFLRPGVVSECEAGEVELGIRTTVYV